MLAILKELYISPLSDIYVNITLVNWNGQSRLVNLRLWLLKMLETSAIVKSYVDLDSARKK